MTGLSAREERPGARQLARRAMKAQVSEMALGLFLEKGYEQTTIDDICAVAGISRSTFFRYFPSKEDLFMDTSTTAGEELLRALRQRPDDEAPWTALRHVMGQLLEHYTSLPNALSLARLAKTTPVLEALSREKWVSLQNLLLPEIARRLGADPHDAADPRPRALIAAAVGCLDATIVAWSDGDGTQPLRQILRRAMDSISS